MLPGCKMLEVGIREGEKLHEVMITPEDALTTFEYESYYIIYPQMVFNERMKATPIGKKVPIDFRIVQKQI